MLTWSRSASCFFFNDTATTEIYTLSLHDALPISTARANRAIGRPFYIERGEGAYVYDLAGRRYVDMCTSHGARSEEHTSELQSRQYLVCRLLLEKKKLRLARRLLPPAGPRPAGAR